LFDVGRTSIPAIVLGLKELKAKAVPDMVSVLSTAASEDVAHLLGGVDLALSSLQASSRRIPGVGSGARLLQAVVLFVDRVGVLHLAPLLRRRSPC